MAPLENADHGQPVPDDVRAPAVDVLMRAFLYMAQQSGRPITEADVPALVPIAESGFDRPTFLIAARRLGLVAHAFALQAVSLEQLALPFAVLHDDRLAHLVVGREASRWILFDLVGGRPWHLSTEQVRALG